jgi:SAM-dependent methyltransferase
LIRIACIHTQLDHYMSPLRNLVKRALFRVTHPPALPEISVREAYRLWAPTYAAETATSFLDDELAQQMLHALPQTRLLDAGCGIGRRIRSIPGAVGIDQSPEMLAAGGATNVVAGDIRCMAFASDHFDMVWCRLVLGHLPDPLAALREFARVCTPGGYVFLTDFHPQAASAGHQRTLTDRDGAVHAIEHYVHTNHVELAVQAGLELIEHRDGAVGPSVRSFYIRGIGVKAYKRDLGLKLVTAFLFQKPASPNRTHTMR